LKRRCEQQDEENALHGWNSCPEREKNVLASSEDDCMGLT
jgi:hypothetical protein